MKIKNQKPKLDFTSNLLPLKKHVFVYLSICFSIC